MSAKDKPTRPRQMEGSIHLLQNIPDIQPDRYMKKIKLHSPSITISLNGKIGFFYEVGGTNGIEARERASTEKLLPIHYSARITRKTQLDKFPIIVAADGYRSLMARKTGLLNSRRLSKIGIGIGFNVKGEFDPELVEVWLDNYFSLHGYTYLIPFSNHEASLVSVSIGKTINIQTYKQRLQELAKSKKLEIQEEWTDFETWYDFASYTGNGLYLIGNAASFTEAAFGFGLKWAIHSAKICAKAIHTNVNYNNLLDKELLPELKSFQDIGRFFEAAKDDDYDRFVKTFKNPLVKKIAESGASLFRYRHLMRNMFQSK